MVRRTPSPNGFSPKLTSWQGQADLQHWVRRYAARQGPGWRTRMLTRLSRECKDDGLLLREEGLAGLQERGEWISPLSASDLPALSV